MRPFKVIPLVVAAHGGIERDEALPLGDEQERARAAGGQSNCHGAAFQSNIRGAVDARIPPDRRLLLIRHGRSSHIQRGWITASGFRAWREEYEASGISEEERAPEQLQKLVSRADLVLSSDASRAVATARLLASGRPIVESPLLRELDLESPLLGGLRLPLVGWAVGVGGRALLLRLRGKYPTALEAARLEKAADWLGELALQHFTIAAVTHAMFRKQLAERLIEAGWHAESNTRSLKHWSAWSFRRG